MFARFTAILVDADDAQRTVTAEAVAGSGVVVAAELDTIDTLASVLRRPDAPRVVIVNLDPDARETLRRLGSLVRQFPATHFFAMSRGATVDLVTDAMHLGVREFISLPLDRARLVAGLERAAEGSRLERRARVIQFVPTIGGCGATTIACGVAAALAKRGKTLIVDLDLVRGAVANGFDVRPQNSIADLTGAGAGPLDSAKLMSMLAVQREIGLSVLARPEAPEEANRVTPEGLARLIDAAGGAFDFVVLDSTMSLDPLHAAAAQAADLNVLVMQLSVPSAKNTERYLHALRRMGIDASKTRIAVNRFVPQASDIQPSEIERALGLKIAWTLPNDFETAMAAINYGEPVTVRSPRTELSKSLVALADMLAGNAPAAQASPDLRRLSPAISAVRPNP